MLVAFYSEALRFLNVPKDKWAELKIGMRSDGTEGKLKIISIDYTQRKIIVYLPVLKILLLHVPTVTGDSPTIYRSYGYKLARLWHQYLNTGQQRIFELDKDSSDFALALCILKGLPLLELPNDEITKIGYYQYDIEAALRMLREEFSIDCCIKIEHDLSIKAPRLFVMLKDNDFQHRREELIALREESDRLFLPIINEGEMGSESNPFANIDAASDYILAVEKERLAKDVYRKKIEDEQYYFDLEHRFFRVSWASPNVSYYPWEGAANPCFVVNQLSQQRGRYNEMPRFSIKPSLANNKFLFRGQSEFFANCVPGLFRDEQKVKKHQFVDDIIQINELEILLRQHPLVKLFEEGFYLLHEFFRFRVDYVGLAQHYYGRTPMLDLTSEIDVAKFFAVTRFNMEKDRYEKYEGDKLGVLYYYDLASDAFTHREGRNYFVETIGKQPFMRSGNQSGFLIRLSSDKNFNELPEVRYVFFRHDKSITDRIFASAGNGDKYMPQEMLRDHWRKRMSDEKSMKEISKEALRLNFENNKGISHSSIVKELHNKGDLN